MGSDAFGAGLANQATLYFRNFWNREGREILRMMSASKYKMNGRARGKKAQFGRLKLSKMGMSGRTKSRTNAPKRYRT